MMEDIVSDIYVLTAKVNFWCNLSLILGSIALDLSMTVALIIIIRMVRKE